MVGTRAAVFVRVGESVVCAEHENETEVQMRPSIMLKGCAHVSNSLASHDLCVLLLPKTHAQEQQATSNKQI